MKCKINCFLAMSCLCFHSQAPMEDGLISYNSHEKVTVGGMQMDLFPLPGDYFSVIQQDSTKMQYFKKLEDCFSFLDSSTEPFRNKQICFDKVTQSFVCQFDNKIFLRFENFGDFLGRTRSDKLESAIIGDFVKFVTGPIYHVLYPSSPLEVALSHPLLFNVDLEEKWTDKDLFDIEQSFWEDLCKKIQTPEHRAQVLNTLPEKLYFSHEIKLSNGLGFVSQGNVGIFKDFGKKKKRNYISIGSTKSRLLSSSLVTRRCPAVDMSSVDFALEENLSPHFNKPVVLSADDLISKIELQITHPLVARYFPTVCISNILREFKGTENTLIEISKLLDRLIDEQPEFQKAFRDFEKNKLHEVGDLLGYLKVLSKYSEFEKAVTKEKSVTPVNQFSKSGESLGMAPTKRSHNPYSVNSDFFTSPDRSSSQSKENKGWHFDPKARSGQACDPAAVEFDRLNNTLDYIPAEFDRLHTRERVLEVCHTNSPLSLPAFVTHSKFSNHKAAEFFDMELFSALIESCDDEKLLQFIEKFPDFLKKRAQFKASKTQKGPICLRKDTKLVDIALPTIFGDFMECRDMVSEFLFSLNFNNVLTIKLVNTDDLNVEKYHMLVNCLNDIFNTLAKSIEFSPQNRMIFNLDCNITEEELLSMLQLSDDIAIFAKGDKQSVVKLEDLFRSNRFVFLQDYLLAAKDRFLQMPEKKEIDFVVCDDFNDFEAYSKTPNGHDNAVDSDSEGVVMPFGDVTLNFSADIADVEFVSGMFGDIMVFLNTFLETRKKILGVTGKFRFNIPGDINDVMERLLSLDKAKLDNVKEGLIEIANLYSQVKARKDINNQSLIREFCKEQFMYLGLLDFKNNNVEKIIGDLEGKISEIISQIV